MRTYTKLNISMCMCIKQEVLLPAKRVVAATYLASLIKTLNSKFCIVNNRSASKQSDTCR